MDSSPSSQVPTSHTPSATPLEIPPPTPTEQQQQQPHAQPATTKLSKQQRKRLERERLTNGVHGTNDDGWLRCNFLWQAAHAVMSASHEPSSSTSHPLVQDKSTLPVARFLVHTMKGVCSRLVRRLLCHHHMHSVKLSLLRL